MTPQPTAEIVDIGLQFTNDHGEYVVVDKQTDHAGPPGEPLWLVSDTDSDHEEWLVADEIATDDMHVVHEPDERTSLPMDRKVFVQLKRNKGEYESWNQFFLALTRLAEEHHEPVTLPDD